MNNNKTPASTVIFYIIGIILLIVSAFMLVTAITYTKTYLQSYDASFSDMWSNSIQYIITQFVPYFGMGIICLGLGRAIKGSAAAKAAAPIAERSDQKNRHQQRSTQHQDRREGKERFLQNQRT